MWNTKSTKSYGFSTFVVQHTCWDYMSSFPTKADNLRLKAWKKRKKKMKIKRVKTRFSSLTEIIGEKWVFSYKLLCNLCHFRKCRLFLHKNEPCILSNFSENQYWRVNKLKEHTIPHESHMCRLPNGKIPSSIQCVYYTQNNMTKKNKSI